MPTPTTHVATKQIFHEKGCLENLEGFKLFNIDYQHLSKSLKHESEGK